MRNVKNLTIFVLLLTLVSTTAMAATHYVNPGESIQGAIDSADPGDEIEVAPGTYTEAINFKGKAVRLYSAYGRDATTIDATGIDASVVTCTSVEGSGTILEGFTVTGGNGVFGYEGGGMYNEASSPTVINCTFSGNHAGYGGGMSNHIYNENDICSPTVTNCTFSDNTAGAGGGMYNGGANPTVTNCIFSGNEAHYGGGMWNYLASPTVTNCTFSSNTSDTRGSGMYNEYKSYPTVTNCTFTSNTGSGGMWNRLYASPTVTNCTFTSNTGSGGMWNFEYASPTVTNCTFSSNTSGLHGGGMSNDYNSDPTVTNCIFWGNGSESQPQIVNVSNSTSDVTYSDVQFGTGEPWFGTGCIDADPMFADADGRLLAGSPCIDAGNDAAVPSGVTTDLDGNPRIQGACVDMGAFEALAEPEMMLAGLALFIMDEVDAGNIDAEMEVSLLAKINAALAALDRDNPNDAKVAMNDLKALVNQVEAQTDKKITPETAAVIIQRANDIIAELGG